MSLGTTSGRPQESRIRPQRAGWPGRARALVLALAALSSAVACTLAGCGTDAPAALRLGWQFADGRTCADAGVTLVVIELPDGEVRAFSCIDGEAPASVRLDELAGSEVRLLAGARTAQGATLYRGDAEAALTPGRVTAATIVLQYTGGNPP